MADGRLLERGALVVAEIGAAGAYGLDPRAFRLPAAASGGGYDTARAGQAEVLISLAVLAYARHARGGRAEPNSLSPDLDRTLPLLDPLSVIGAIAEAPDAARYLRELNPQHPQFEALRQKYNAARDSDVARAAKLLVNMEEWRWMPERLGDLYVIVNVPEFMLRVVRAGEVIHTERVVVGKADKQTPIFSADLDEVIFHPSWGVPDSIKTNDILPSLLRGSTRLLERYNLRVQRGGRDVDPASIDWAATDMRTVRVYQPPGASNVLGFVKFRFPNKHDVYMHDTPDKRLFTVAVRAFSHGCMRLSEPQRLAELVLGEQAWSAERVDAAIRAANSSQVALQRPIPVHITYFTAVVDPQGNLSTFPDIYGHELRIAMGIAGKAHLIPKPASGGHAEVIGRLQESAVARAADWKWRAFGNN
jgi:murein L,D-transpeptidase YcbB/YkuD